MPPPEFREVVLSLHSVHNVKHSPDESYYGMATNHNQEAELAVTSARPAKFLVSRESIVSLRIFLHLRGKKGKEDRAVGQVSIPIREMIEICGPCIYQTWFLLDHYSAYGSQPRSQVAGHFRRAWAEVSSRLHSPRICISLMEVTVDPSTWMNSAEDRAFYHDPLFVSHAQHLQTVQAYLDYCDREKLDFRKQRKRQPGEEIPEDTTSRRRAEEQRLRVQLDQLTLQANQRIEKSNEEILRLNAQLKEMMENEDPDLEQERQDILATLQERRRHADELQRRSESTGHALRGLQDEVQQLKEEKEALFLEVQEIYSKQKAVPVVEDRLLPEPSDLRPA